MASPRTIKGQIRAWSKEMDRHLRSCIEGHYSFSQAAAAVNERFGTSFTRCAAIGRAARIGIEVVRLPKVAKAKKPPRQTRATLKPISLAEVSSPVIDVEPRHLPLIELKAGDCRFPLGTGPYTFCGNPKCDDSSYCYPHRMICEGPGTASERSVAPIGKRKSAIREAA